MAASTHRVHWMTRRPILDFIFLDAEDRPISSMADSITDFVAGGDTVAFTSSEVLPAGIVAAAESVTARASGLSEDWRAYTDLP